MPDDELINRLRDFAARTHHVQASVRTTMEDAADRLSALQARNAELERDARRYRWLRSQKHMDIAACYLFPPCPKAAATPEEIDAAIDSALSQEPTRQGQQEGGK